MVVAAPVVDQLEEAFAGDDGAAVQDLSQQLGIGLMLWPARGRISGFRAQPVMQRFPAYSQTEARTVVSLRGDVTVNRHLHEDNEVAHIDPSRVAANACTVCRGFDGLARGASAGRRQPR